ncbi:hypothetical protein EDD16DRAFT_1603804 [Pisolithus croceorrhizus]|nr:hypothetical protein EDD16DRAFT_1603804 [Pisolithus croceorrhizus]KAI6169748.1 hypothetical protein EDD17DRAFT_1520926 [Pisolithus thermaeus]
MSSSYMQNIGTKLFAKHIQQYTPEDPMYETYTDERGRQKRRKRQIPPGLSERDAKILKSVQRRAHYLDRTFSVCGLRFGWAVVIGLIPGIGDFADVILAYLVVLRKARQAELPEWLVRRMLLNLIISGTVGFVPGVGDVVVGMYKANFRNAQLLEEFLRIRGEEFLKTQTGGQNGTRAPRLSEKDAEQVKPGAGMEDGTGHPSTSSTSRSKTGKKKAEN